MFRLARLARHPAPEAPVPAATADASIEEQIVAALRTVFDPEIPVNVYDLGLIYAIEVGAAGAVEIRMTLTAPACPVAGMMPGLVESAVRQVDGVTAVKVDLVWDPPWSKERMSDEARLQLGML
jgi:FeS assembly SUF system protein